MRSSAGKTVRGHITKEGNKYLRWVLERKIRNLQRIVKSTLQEERDNQSINIQNRSRQTFSMVDRAYTIL